MEFKKFKNLLESNIQELIKDEAFLFEVNLDKDELWELYLDSFPAGTNEIYRERREYDCSACRQFIKNFGNVVVINDNKIKTIWDLETDSDTFQPVVDSLNEFVKSAVIQDVYVTDTKYIGVDKNYENVEGEILEWNHLYLELPPRFVSRGSRSYGDIKGELRSSKEVFKRSLDEISEESLNVVLDLIYQNSLYKGEEWKNILIRFRDHKKVYDKLEKESERDNYSWKNSLEEGSVISRIRNHSIGTLLVDISENVDLNVAVTKYESIVAPENYKRPKAIYTKKMLEDAQRTVEKLGYMDSLARRYANLDDITVNDILFSNKDSSKRIVGANVFDDMIDSISVDPKKYSRVDEISIEDFINNVLPLAEELEVLFENKHKANMVSLIAPLNKDSKSMFKWDNNFGWAYTGNLTDSSMRDNVKAAGGNVEGILRFSIQWNDESYNPNDFDAHCIEPKGNEIYYGNKHNRNTTGNLDVDIISPTKNIPAVENITWLRKDSMEVGLYKLFVHNYSHNGGRDGFKAEVEFDGKIYSFEYDKELRQGERVQVAEVYLDEYGNFTIKEKLQSNLSSREIWGLDTNQFVPVSVVCFSPNYWGDNVVGNKHYMFMLKGCINPEQPNGYYNEFLDNELSKHKRVFEALSSRMKVEDTEDQLSGLGFSSTQRNELTVKVKGNTERVLKIKF